MHCLDRLFCTGYTLNAHCGNLHLLESLATLPLRNPYAIFNDKYKWCCLLILCKCTTALCSLTQLPHIFQQGFNVLCMTVYLPQESPLSKFADLKQFSSLSSLNETNNEISKR